MSDLDEAGVSGYSTPPKKKTKNWYQQCFKKEWLVDPEFKDWLQADAKDKYAAVCTICDAKLKNCNRSRLLTHKTSAKHLKCFSSKKSSLSIEHFVHKKKPEKDFQSKVFTAELYLAAYMAENSVPFSHANHLVEIQKKMFPECQIAQEMKMKKTKASYVIQDGIAWEEKQEMAKICRENRFSLIIDESTDIAVSQNLAIMVRFYDKKRLKVTDALLDIVEVDDASGEGLYRAVKELLISKDIPLTNVIGFASDNCSTMMGSNTGFQAHLKKDIPSVFVIGCVCHSFALCSSYACSHLPSFLESYLKNVCCYFARSSKRQSSFKLIQDIVDSPKHKMLKLSQTRWLSRGEVIGRVLEQWEALLLFFESESRTDKIDGATGILETMKNRGTKHMLLFLNYVIKKVDKMNAEFQSEYFRLSSLYSTIADEYRSITGMFIKQEILESHKLSEIDPRNSSNYLDIKDLHLGGRCEALLLNEPIGEGEKKFRLDCQKFLTELCVQIRKRFPFEDDSVLALLQVLDPKLSLSPQKRMKSIIKLASHFPQLVKDEDLDDLDDQWQSLLHARSCTENLDQSPCSFWAELGDIKDGTNKCKFDILSNFMCSLLALPHSSAAAERIFSQVNLIKNKQTNRLLTDTVANRLLAKQAIARQDVSCYDWKPSSFLLNELKTGQCHQRYLKRSKKCTEVKLHPAEEEDEDISEMAKPTQVFLL